MTSAKTKSATPPDTYFLPEGYKINPVLMTMDSESGDTYWHARRLNDAYNYQYHVYKYAMDVIQKHNVKRVIDVGCGPAIKLGLFHDKYPDLDITGIDQDHPIEYCKSTHKYGRWLVDDFENPRSDIPNLEADLVINADVIEHVMNPDNVLNYIAHRMAPDGLALISTPDRARNYGHDKMESGHPAHIREWTKDEFAQYLQSRGWEILEHFHLPGMRAGMNHAYIRSLAYHILKGKPKHMDYNQVVLAKAPKG